MESKNKNGSSTQGVENPQELSLEKVKEFLKKDVNACLHMLEAIYRDQPTMDALASYIYGRYQNSKHLEKLKEEEQQIN